MRAFRLRFFKTALIRGTLGLHVIVWFIWSDMSFRVLDVK